MTDQTADSQQAFENALQSLLSAEDTVPISITPVETSEDHLIRGDE